MDANALGEPGSQTVVPRGRSWKGFNRCRHSISSDPFIPAAAGMLKARCISCAWCLLRSKPRLVDKPRLFLFGFRCVLFAGRAGRLSLRRFLVVEPLRL